MYSMYLFNFNVLQRVLCSCWGVRQGECKTLTWKDEAVPVLPFYFWWIQTIIIWLLRSETIIFTYMSRWTWRPWRRGRTWWPCSRRGRWTPGSGGSGPPAPSAPTPCSRYHAWTWNIISSIVDICAFYQCYDSIFNRSKFSFVFLNTE